VLKVAHLYRIHEREILIQAFDEGYRSGKKIIDTSGKDYYLFNYTKTN
jgi:hypothetical protein